jgi:DNA-binding FadR family transcriptional regulator
MRKLIAKDSLYKHVMHELGRRIVSGEVPPGEVLPSEAVLAEDLQVSRSALREALRVLSAKGLIESCSGVGARVHEARHWVQLDADVLAWRCAFNPTDDFVDQLVDMRRVIEPAAAASAAQWRSEQQFAAIHVAFQAMAVAPASDVWAAAELRFYDAVLQAADNEFLRSLFSVVEAALSASYTMCVRDAGDFKLSLPHYGKAVEAIRCHQPESANEAMLAIIDDSHDRLCLHRHARGNCITDVSGAANTAL